MSIFAKHYLLPALIFIILLGVSCSKSDDQRRFEEEALRPPQHITETNAAGDTTGTVDKDDWRIGPMFRASISLGTLGESQAPFPNPVGLNTTIHIYLTQPSLDRVTRLEVYQLTGATGPHLVQIFEEYEVNSGLNDLRIPASLIAEGQGSTASDLYRLLIYDGAQNLITYGDIRIQ
ncbi:MAG TPA: hypothetical protein VK112_08250 [Fodinibius sp.]|nr:hypothetical protein [Fodinibius sp.]